jgi:hypothetical protein
MVAPGAGETPAEESQAVVSSAIPHDLEGRDDCLLCHELGGAKPFPEYHEGWTLETRTLCHQVAAPAEDEEAETEEAEPAAAEDPLSIPHDLEGRDDCLLCHDLDGANPFPEDHEGRTSDICQACHKPGGEGES